MTDNGATEIPGSSYDSPVVFLGSSIRHWWKKTEDGKTLHETPAFKAYSSFREYVRGVLAGNGFMVYSPHLALKGNWNEEAGTEINDFALSKSHAFVAIRITGVEQVGTDHEEFQAFELGLPTFTIKYPPRVCDLSNVLDQMDKALKK